MYACVMQSCAVESTDWHAKQLTLAAMSSAKVPFCAFTWSCLPLQEAFRMAILRGHEQ